MIHQTKRPTSFRPNITTRIYDETNPISNFPVSLFYSTLIPQFTIPILTALVFHRNTHPLHSAVGILWSYSIMKGARRRFFIFSFIFSYV